MECKADRLRPHGRVITIVSFVGAIAAWMLSGGEPQALPQQSPGTPGAPTTAASSRTPIRIERPPARILQDPYAAFSAVAVDAAREEIVLQDENRDFILIYNRLDDTPPTAAMTEPKRMIGGRKTKISSNCGVYIDPFSGDIYSVNNDVQNAMSIFSREAKGDVPPDRELNTPHRTFGIAADELTQELFLTIQHPPAVVVYRKMAKGKDAPLRVLEGDQTQLADSHGIALDTKNQWMYVSNRGAASYMQKGMGFAGVPVTGEGEARTWAVPDYWYEYYRDRFVAGSGNFALPSITVYPLRASGNTSPVRVIQGPQTRLNWPAHIHLDLARQELFVANALDDSILVFRATDTGNVAPLRVLKGPHTKLKHPHGVFVDETNQEIVVANFGNHAATVYPRTAGGDTPPLRTIRSAPDGTPAPMFGNVGSLAYDTKRDEILAPN